MEEKCLGSDIPRENGPLPRVLKSLSIAADFSHEGYQSSEVDMIPFCWTDVTGTGDSMKKNNGLATCCILLVVFPLLVLSSSISFTQSSEKPLFLQTGEELLAEGKKRCAQNDLPGALRVLYLAQLRLPESEDCRFEYEMCRYFFALERRDAKMLEAVVLYPTLPFDDPQLEAKKRSMTGLAASLLDGNTSFWWSQASEHWSRACELEPENLDGKKKLLWAQLKTGQFVEAEQLLSSLLSQLPDDPYLYEAATMKIALEMQAQFNQQPHQETIDQGVEYCLKALELSLKTKADPDLFAERFKNEITPVNQIRELVSPSDREVYIKRMRELKNSGNQALWGCIASMRIHGIFNTQNRQYYQDAFQQLAVPNRNNPLFCLEFGLTFDFREESGYLQAMDSFERLINDGTLRGTGIFYRGDANNWRGLGGNLPELIEKTIPDFEEAVKLAPDWPYAYLKLGWSYLHTKRLIEAEQTFQKGMAVAPEHSQLLRGLGNVYLECWKADRSNLSLMNKALHYAKRLDDRDLENYCRNELRQAGHYDYRSVPEAFTADDVTQSGFTFQQEGQMKEALECFEWIKENYPDPGSNLPVSPYLKAAEIHYADKNWNAVVENLTFHDLRRTGESPVEAMEMFAHALVELKRYDDLSDYYTGMLLGDSNDLKAGKKQLYIAKVLKLSNKGTPQEIYEAIPYWDHELRADPDALPFMLEVALEAKELNEAKLCFESLLSFDAEKYYEYALQLGKIHSERNDHSEAADLYEKFLEYEPENESVKRLLLAALYRGTFYQRCTDFLIRYLREKPEEKRYWLQLAAVLEQYHAPQIETFTPVLALELTPENVPDYDDILESRINILRILRLHDEAIRDLEILRHRGKTAGRLFLSRSGEKTSSHKTDVENSLALLYLTQEKYDDVIRVLNQISAQQKNTLQKEISHSILAETYIVNNEWKKAIPELEAIRKNHLGKQEWYEEPTILMMIGNCHLKNGEAMEAGKAFSASLSLDPNCFESNLGRYEACMLMLQNPDIQKDTVKKTAFENQARKDLLAIKQSSRLIRRFPAHENKILDKATLKEP